MEIFQGKIHRYLILTVVSYCTLSFLGASFPRHVTQAPQDNKQGIENILPKENPGDKLEEELLKRQQKPIEPKDKYGPQWQEEIRRNYRTELT